MSLVITFSREYSNTWRPTPWHWSLDPFPAFRGEGARHGAFLPVARDYAPRWMAPIPDAGVPTSAGWFLPRATAPGPDQRRDVVDTSARVFADASPSKVIRTAKGGLLLVPCAPDQDERILLVALRGGYCGGWGRIEAHAGEILDRRISTGNRVPTGHLVVRLHSPAGYLAAESGHRSSRGAVECHTWRRGVMDAVSSDQYDAALRGAGVDTAPTHDKSPTGYYTRGPCSACGENWPLGQICYVTDVATGTHVGGGRCIPCYAQAVGAIRL